MKYIPLFSLIVLCFIWCTQNGSSLEPIQVQETQQSTQSLSTWGTFDWDLSIEWLRGLITIWSGKLQFEWLFSINMPQSLHNWGHEKYIPNTTHNQNLSFWENTNTNRFYVTVWDTRLLKKSLTNKDICLLQTNYNWSPTEAKETITKNIGNKEIFITHVTFLTESNIDPYRYTYITHLCFVDDTVVYDIVLDNYPFDYANQIIDSLTFLD